MHGFGLDEIILLSHRERRARKVKFHPNVTLIKGQNDTGKSSVIKSIFWAFGANPATVHPLWKQADISSVIRFRTNETRYSLYRYGSHFSLFSHTDELLGSFQSISNELGPHIAELFDFKLMLTEQSGDSKVPPPAFMFLPFYIDQDHGWSKNWASFEKLQQFKNWRQDLVYYHTGIRPNKWYVVNSQKKSLEAEKEKPLDRERILGEVMRSMESRMVNVNFDVDVRSYKREIDRLISKCETLRKLEQKYKSKLIDLESDRIRLEAQRDIVAQARNELDADYEYAADLDEDHIDCPTCGAGYSNSLADRFAIAQDQDRCIGLLQQLSQAHADLMKKLEQHRLTLAETSKELASVNSILTKKQGKITLKTLIENEGKKEVSSVLRSDLKDTQHQIAQIDERLRELQAIIKKLDDKERRMATVQEYRSWMRQYLQHLNVRTLPEKAYAAIDSSIKETGSDQPRALLAYFLSILQLVRSRGNTPNFPIVIDAPNQQEQDENNIRRMLELLKGKRPLNSQLVLGLVDDYGIDFGGTVVEMSEPHRALRLEEYEDLAFEMRSYTNASLLG
ncbi:AAA family ATPase [Nitrospira defluvii]|uniref:Rad50/SbcC-type AAA domain-containing protein n=1 Tax=Nitrospira defluvii TaxID=330214 RepID=A0ABM8RHG8_9BACT|nr:AAA family ATPase [Nitrospira defluvii]CAE6753429.1 conserved hypothetical protein [Nitrospira defluvii]